MSGALQPFKEGAFILARNTRAPILPVILDGAGSALPKNGFWFRTNQVFVIRILDEIPSETISQFNLRQLIDHTHEIMNRELEKIRCRQKE